MENRHVCPPDFTLRERKTTGKQTFHVDRLHGNDKSDLPRDRLGWEGKTNFHENCVDGTTATSIVHGEYHFP